MVETECSAETTIAFNGGCQQNTTCWSLDHWPVNLHFTLPFVDAFDGGQGSVDSIPLSYIKILVSLWYELHSCYFILFNKIKHNNKPWNFQTLKTFHLIIY